MFFFFFSAGDGRAKGGPEFFCKRCRHLHQKRTLAHRSPNPTKLNNTVEGVLKGYDQLLNLVLDEAIEFQRSAEDILTVTDETRPLGLVVCRGTAVMAVAPTAGAEVMASNPFLGAGAATEEEGGGAAAAAEEVAKE